MELVHTLKLGWLGSNISTPGNLGETTQHSSTNIKTTVCHTWRYTQRHTSHYTPLRTGHTDSPIHRQPHHTRQIPSCAKHHFQPIKETTQEPPRDLHLSHKQHNLYFLFNKKYKSKTHRELAPTPASSSMALNASAARSTAAAAAASAAARAAPNLSASRDSRRASGASCKCESQTRNSTLRATIS